MKIKKKVALFLIILFFCSISVNITISDRTLTVTNYSFKTNKTTAKLRAVVLSDLHNKEFGKNNIRLLEKVREQKPDVIFTLGDFVTKHIPDRTTAIKLYKELVKICDVYAVNGNHEKSYPELNELKKEMKDIGVCLLDNEMKSIQAGSGHITVGGLSGYPYFEYFAPDYNNSQRKFLDKFVAQQDENFSILLTHFPEMLYWGLHGNKVELMICGHTHGGIFRLPYIGGLLAPNQGILAGKEELPEFTKGLYTKDGTTMIVNGGLGNEVPLPRYYNPPEISVIDIN